MTAGFSDTRDRSGYDLMRNLQAQRMFRGWIATTLTLGKKHFAYCLTFHRHCKQSCKQNKCDISLTVSVNAELTNAQIEIGYAKSVFNSTFYK